MFREAYAKRRCLVPADAFYEWKVQPGGGKRPMTIAPKSGEGMAFAGIREGWRGEGGEVVRTFAIVTTDANSPMRAIHDRMPVVLAPGDWAEWLEGDDPARLLRPAPDDLLRLWPVSKAVNSPRNNGPELLAEHASAATEGGGPTLTALSAELLKRAARIDAVQVNYAGSGPASLALLSGEIDFSVDTLSSAIGQVEQGQVKALAVTSRRRAARLPAVPTLDETVAPGFDVTGWFGVLAPAGTPAPMVERLNRDLNAALEAPAVAAQLGELGLERIGGGAEGFAGLLRSETERWGGLIRELGLKPE